MSRGFPSPWHHVNTNVAVKTTSYIPWQPFRTDDSSWCTEETQITLTTEKCIYLSQGCKALTAFAIMSLYCDFHTAEEGNAEHVLELKTKEPDSQQLQVVMDQWQVEQNLVQRY